MYVYVFATGLLFFVRMYYWHLRNTRTFSAGAANSGGCYICFLIVLYMNTWTWMYWCDRKSYLCCRAECSVYHRIHSYWHADMEPGILSLHCGYLMVGRNACFCMREILVFQASLYAWFYELEMYWLTSCSGTSSCSSRSRLRPPYSCLHNTMSTCAIFYNLKSYSAVPTANKFVCVNAYLPL